MQFISRSGYLCSYGGLCIDARGYQRSANLGPGAVVASGLGTAAPQLTPFYSGPRLMSHHLEHQPRIHELAPEQV